MGSPILVTGGTGTLGREVVPSLVGAGRDVRVLSRRGGTDGRGVAHVRADLLAGVGLADALAGVGTVVHLAGGPKGDDVATRNLADAAASAGVGHLVFVSVTAADRVPLGYFRRKLAAERIVAASGVPWTTLRAAQFHDFVLDVVGRLVRLPVVPVPGGMRAQPVDVRDVAERLAALALGGPAGRVADLAGPRVLGLDEAVRDVLRASGRRRPLLPVRVPGAAGRVYRAGENLVAATPSDRTWEAFLAART